MKNNVFCVKFSRFDSRLTPTDSAHITQRTECLQVVVDHQDLCTNNVRHWCSHHHPMHRLTRLQWCVSERAIATRIGSVLHVVNADEIALLCHGQHRQATKDWQLSREEGADSVARNARVLFGMHSKRF